MNQYVNKSLYLVIYKDRINELLETKKQVTSAHNEVVQLIKQNTDPKKKPHLDVQLVNYQYSLFSINTQLSYWNHQLETLN